MSITSCVLPFMEREVSSANKATLALMSVVQVGRLLIKDRKGMGPRPNSCHFAQIQQNRSLTALKILKCNVNVNRLYYGGMTLPKNG